MTVEFGDEVVGRIFDALRADGVVPDSLKIEKFIRDAVEEDLFNAAIHSKKPRTRPDDKPV